MPVHGETQATPKMDLTCIDCKKKIKKGVKIFPLGTKVAHYTCLLKRIKRERFPIYDFSINYMMYIYDKQMERQVYRTPLKQIVVFSNRQCYKMFGRDKKPIIRLIHSGIFGSPDTVLGGILMVPYSLCKEVYEKQKKHFLTYYIASKIKIMGIKDFHYFYNDINVIQPAIHGEDAFPVLFNFSSKPTELIDMWLRSFCDKENLLYYTNSRILAKFFNCDRNLAIKCSTPNIPEKELKGKVIKFLRGEKIETIDISKQPALRDVFQGKDKKEESNDQPAAIEEKKEEDKNDPSTKHPTEF